MVVEEKAKHRMDDDKDSHDNDDNESQAQVMIIAFLLKARFRHGQIQVNFFWEFGKAHLTTVGLGF